MAKTWDEKTNDRISELDSNIQGPAADFINAAYAAGIQLRVTDAYRTHAEQDALYAKGRTSPGRIVTDAKGGESYHNYRLAIDVVEIRGGKTIYDKRDGWPRWDEISKIGIDHGFEWGGNWEKPDIPHFQMNLGFSIKQLQQGQGP